ncbi:MAG: hypothetical protein JXC85_03770 [Candidatus Aenigmarchaeota archaeon]|nr:hypothetical protein [Candidatus Aenigmarchaeota archaeon]
MAFGFLGSLLGRKKPAHEEGAPASPAGKKRLETANVLEWLNGQLAQEIAQERETYSAWASELLGLIRDFRKIVEGIRQRSFEAGDRTYAAVNMIKDTWSKKALLSLTSFFREIRNERITTESMDFPALRDLYANTTRLMNEINMIPRQRLVLSRYFEPESKRMAEILKSFGTVTDNIKQAVTGTGTLKSVSRVKDMLSQLNALAGEVKRTVMSIEEARSRLREKEEEIKRLEAQFAEVEKRPEWGELTELDKRIKESLERVDEIELRVSERLGSMKRVFKLFAHDAAELDKDERRFFEDLSHSPLKTFMATDAGTVERGLEKLEKGIESGDFRLSKKDEGKTAELHEMLESGWVSKSKAEHDENRLAASAAKHERDGINVMVEKRETERMLEKSRAELDMLHREESELERKLKEKRGGIKDKKREIAAFVRKELGREIELD